MSKAEAQIPIVQDQLVRRREDRVAVEERQDALGMKMQTHDTVIASTAARKRNLESSRGGGPLAPYGERMNELIGAINQARWQGERPIGPLGVGVKLKQMKYQEVIHTQLGSLLSSFAVTTPNDATQLRAIIRSCQATKGLSVRSLGPSTRVPPGPLIPFLFSLAADSLVRLRVSSSTSPTRTSTSVPATCPPKATRPSSLSSK